MQTEENLKNEKFFSFLQWILALFVIVTVVIIFLWVFDDRIRGVTSFEPVVEFIGLVAALVIELAGLYKVSDILKKLDEVKDQISKEADKVKELAKSLYTEGEESADQRAGIVTQGIMDVSGKVDAASELNVSKHNETNAKIDILLTKNQEHDETSRRILKVALQFRHDFTHVSQHDDLKKLQKLLSELAGIQDDAETHLNDNFADLYAEYASYLITLTKEFVKFENQHLYENGTDLVKQKLIPKVKETAEKFKQRFGKNNELQHQANLKLLGELWKLIKSQHVKEIIQLVSDHNLTDEYINRTLVKYLDEREYKPEKHFTNIGLEEAFTLFDKKLMDFYLQLIREETAEAVGGKNIFVPAYTLSGLSSKLRQEKYDDYRETTRMGDDLLLQHNELVKSVQQIMPEFDFLES